MIRSTFNKHLKSLGEDELREELALLYSKFDDVKSYYAMELGSDQERKKMYEKAKKEITSKYKTKSLRKPRKPRIRRINAILTEMSKKSIFKHELIDLYLFNAESGITFMKNYYFNSTALSNTINNSLVKAFEIIDEALMQEEFITRCDKIMGFRSMYFEFSTPCKSRYQKLLVI